MDDDPEGSPPPSSHISGASSTFSSSRSICRSKAAIDRSVSNDILTCYFVRHGERADVVDPNWRTALPGSYKPYDPPLSPRGEAQAQQTGKFIYDCEASSRAQSCRSSDDRTSQVSYYVTAVGILRGFRQREYLRDKGPLSKWILQLEPGVCDWLAENYHHHDIPITMLEDRQQDIATG
ncbi:hypothetical protein EV182_001540, partial [Spiromyces aspiralis]